MAKEHVHKIKLTCWWIDWGKLIWNPQSLFLYGDHGGVSPHPFFGTLNLQENKWTWCNMSQLYTYYIIYHVDTLDLMIVQVPGWTVARNLDSLPFQKRGRKVILSCLMPPALSGRFTLAPHQTCLGWYSALWPTKRTLAAGRCLWQGRKDGCFRPHLGRHTVDGSEIRRSPVGR